ncbi:hypothetical protein CTAYLR_005477 [Chrysophaeum taylorii]|uniref:AAA+ ATPase domain-containing protein n=1 Tax=Chrysophaeum taylorii TaxID=2483200 RepID=A0AAD7U4R6_9STRA|nr:hypothetical protein CTAYLR_005477 [Chrysophaeum taylorii]
MMTEPYDVDPDDDVAFNEEEEDDIPEEEEEEEEEEDVVPKPASPPPPPKPASPPPPKKVGVARRLAEWRAAQPPVPRNSPSPPPPPPCNKWRGESSDEDEEPVAVPHRRNAGAAAEKREAKSKRAEDFRRHMHETPPLDEESVPMTLEDGSRFYVKTRPAVEELGEEARPTSLLATPVAELRALDDVAERRAPIVLRRAAGGLWVDKYAPQTFQDLLSDDRTNREVLRALKNWDPFVFRKPAPKPPVETTTTRTTTKMASTMISKKKAFAWKKRRKLPPNKTEEDDKVFDEDGRPAKKIVLLAGDPGTGKTTLARVLARFAGYRVIEVNASEDRTKTAIERAVTDAQTNRAVGGRDSKPACVVLDEIDGIAGTQASAALVAMATAPLKKKTLTRPVVCVCNDLYAPSLRSLRDVSAVFHLRNPPTPQRLVGVLRTVAAREGLDVSQMALQALAEASRGDVRACLHALQFASSTASNLDAEVFRAVDSGLKDGAADEFDLWRAVFSKPKPRPPIDDGSNTPKKRTTAKNELSAIIATAASLDADRVVAGVHENYPTVIVRDPGALHTASLADDLSEADLLLRRHDLGARCSAAISCAAGFARRDDFVPKLRIPKLLRPDASAFRAIDDARTRWRPRLERLGTTACALDLAPWLTRVVLDLDVRPVGLELARPREKALLEATATVMAANGLGFERAVLDDGDNNFKPTYKLRPDVVAATTFGGGSGGTVKTPHHRLAPITCQVLSRQVTIALVRHRDGASTTTTTTTAAKKTTTNDDNELPAAKRKKKSPAEIVAAAAAAADQQQQEEEEEGASNNKAVPPKRRRRRRHFSFTQWVVPNKKKKNPHPAVLLEEDENDAVAQQPEPASKKAKVVERPHITFKFNKGFSDAVRRPVFMEDLLLLTS